MADKIPDFSNDVKQSSENVKIPDFNQGNNFSHEGNSLDQDINEENISTITTRNESLEGKEHPETGTKYEKKVVETNTGERVEGVFPQFNSDFDAELPEELLEASDKRQFDEANKQLKDYIDNNKDEAKSKFNSEQLDDIESGYTPEGYTWHHSEDKGIMQLVDTEIHAKTGHTGGKSIWGGGNENR
ncbi:MAG: hypothetical protein CMH98_04595 [Oceanospirillaceae bacterium]|nr:hypothetical protein [Oceanospirillaceae bacterium]